MARVRPGSAPGRLILLVVSVVLVAGLLVPLVPAGASEPALRGTVTDSVSGLGIAGVRVDVYDYDASDPVRETVTGPSGEYSFATLPRTGSYEVDFFSHGHSSAYAYVNYSGTPVVRNVSLDPLTPVVTGEVSEAISGDPIQGVSLFCDYYNEMDEYWEWIGSAQSGPDGEYTIYDEWDHGAGEFVVSTYAPGYLDAEEHIAWNGTDVVVRDIALDPARPIVSGTVTEVGTGMSLEHAYLDSLYYSDVEELWMWAGFASAAADGTYTLYDQEEYGAGEYLFVAMADGYRGAVVERAWDGVELLTEDFELAPFDLEIVEVHGGSRYETAVKSSQLAFPEDGECDAVVIASGRNFPDALGGSALAGALRAPVLLTAPSAVPAVVVDEIDRLGATQVYIVGGTMAVSAEVATALALLPGVEDVHRIGGGNRYDTAANVAAKTVELLGPAYEGHVMFATGANFPDALAAGPIATTGVPILLVRRTSVPDETIGSIQTIDPDFGLVLGGTNAVSASVYSTLRTWLGGAGHIDRISGSSRYETAAMIAERGIWEYGLDAYGTGLATGANYPDALAGGAAQGLTGTVLLLTRTNALDWPTADFLAGWSPNIYELRFFGGTGAISNAVRLEAEEIVYYYGGP